MYYKTRLGLVKALDNVSYSIDQGDSIGLIGINEAGKSTTIKLLCGILRPTTGNICVMEKDPYYNRKKYQKIMESYLGREVNYGGTT